MGALPSGAQEQIGSHLRSRAPDGSVPIFFAHSIEQTILHHISKKIGRAFTSYAYFFGLDTLVEVGSKPEVNRHIVTAM